MCVNNDMVSEDQVDSTTLVELLRQEGWEALKQKMLGMNKYKLSVDGCRIYKSLMSICHAENVFPNEHMNSSNLWISIHQSEFNGSEFYDPEQILQSSNGTSGQPISGIYGWSPVTQDTNTTEQLVSDTPRKKRSPLFLTQLVQVFTNIHALNKAIHAPTTTPTPWVEYYNETHNIIQNYTFMHLVRSTEEKENVTSLGFSNDTQKLLICSLGTLKNIVGVYNIKGY